MPHAFSLLALDLDGTVFDRTGHVPADNVAAIRRAREAGLRVVICTGRGLVECIDGLRAIEQRDPVVVAGGSIIADPVTRHTLHRFNIHQDLVAHAVRIVNAAGHAALVLKDPLEAGFDYLVVNPDGCELDPVTKWWFAKMNVSVRYAANLALDPMPQATVRVGACGLGHVLDKARGELEATLGDRAVIHNFPAVVAPEHVKTLGDGRTLNILELFDKDATKWSAIQHLSKQWEIDAARIVAIGDEINDVSMIQGAGLGIAMGNAIPAVKSIAKHTTRRNDESGVAHAIDQVLSGAWV
jgi:5-amino-6-(5-phospho-D-ribitylamino)uracil phosphatase